MVFWMISTLSPPLNAQAIQAESSSQVQWAIAIHGGAGGDPTTWSDELRALRKGGLEKALQIGRDLLTAGNTSLDAVEAVIRSLEDDAAFNAGRGAVVTEKGNVELDASIMDGKTRGCGAIAGVTTVKNPISTARLVMTNTKHVLLVGQGADAFASAEKVPLVGPEYFLSSRHRSPHGPDELERDHFGTVGCVALDTAGNLAAGTSTGGTPQKLAGRVGDSPIIGAGTFADNGSCAVSGTGLGEEFIRNAVAYDIAAQMIYANKSPQSAVSEIMTQRLKPGVGGVICVSHDGQIVLQHNTPGMSCGAADSSGRFETFLFLENGGRTQVADADSLGKDEAEISELINGQADAWNDGDLDRFMSVYWKSESLTFASGGNITRGWDATIDRYRKRYPDKKTMGQVAFTDLEFLRLDQAAFQVLGVWNLHRDIDPIGGRFTLVFRKQSDGWKIVHDHTSMLEKE